MDKIQNHPVYKVIFKNAWPYWVGGILLGLLNVCLFIVQGKPWGVTTTFVYWGTWIMDAVGIDPSGWDYFQIPNNAANQAKNFLTHSGSVMNIGIIVGALFAALAASQFKIKKIKSWKQVASALGGGLIMGYGARIAFGCNIGAFFSGIASLSLHGWLYAVFIFIGAWIGSKILVKFLM